MMKKPEDLVIAIIDYGTFTYFAERLVGHFKKVYITNPRSGPFPLTDRDDIASGLAGVTNIPWPEFWKHIEEIDIIWFPFINDGWMAQDFRNRGKLVVSTGAGEILERDRDLFKKTLISRGLPVIPYRDYPNGLTVFGWDALREQMQYNKNFWVKMSDFRGIGETHKVKDYDESEHWLFELGHLLGGQRRTFPFHLEDHMDGEEIGDDPWFNGTKFFDKLLYGKEEKDAGYLCKVISYSKLPQIVKDIHDKMIPELKKYGVQSPLSTELRVHDKDTAFFTDACMRIGSPPGELICEMWANLPEMLVAVASGEDIEQEVSIDEDDNKPALYGASIFLYSEKLKSEITTVTFPKSIGRWVKLQNYYRRDGKSFCIPQDGGSCIGSAIGIGSTAESAEMKALEVAEQIRADGLHYSENVFDRIDESVEKARKLGVWV